jgi:hypothetical protein
MGLLDDISSSLPDYLPSDPQKREAAKMGLLSMGAAMLGANTRDFGRALGTGAQSGITGYQGAYELAQKTGLQQAQMKLLQNQDTRTQEQFAVGRSLVSGQPLPQGGPAGQGAGLLSMPTAGSPAPGNPLFPASPMASWGGASEPQPAPQSAPQQGGFLSRVTPEQALGYQMMGGIDMLPAIKYARQGTKFDQGSVYEMPDGTRKYFAKLDNGMEQDGNGVVRNATNYTQSAAANAGAITGAQEAAKAPYGFTTVTPAGGRPTMMTNEQLRGQVTGGQPASPAPAFMPPSASLPPSMNQPAQGANGPVRDLSRMTKDEQQRMFNTALIQASPAFRNQGKLPAAPSGTPGLALQSDVETKTELGAVDTTLKAGQGLNENWIKQTHNPVQTEGKAADNTLAQLESIKNINLTTGSGTEFKAAATAVLSSLGVATKDMEKYLGNTQKFQQVAMERNMTMLQAQAGPQTDGDSQRAQQTFVKLGNTPAANQFIVDLTAANARMAKQKASYYNEALPIARARGDLTEIDRRWSKIAPSIWSDPALSKYKGK